MKSNFCQANIRLTNVTGRKRDLSCHECGMACDICVPINRGSIQKEEKVGGSEKKDCNHPLQKKIKTEILLRCDKCKFTKRISGETEWQYEN